MLMKSSVLVVDSREAALTESGDVILSGVSLGVPWCCGAEFEMSGAWDGLCWGWRSTEGWVLCWGCTVHGCQMGNCFEMSVM